jgi:hypothetical protein
MKESPRQVCLKYSGLMGLVLAFALVGCVQVKTEPIKIEPIYIEITVNHKVQKELDDVFADIDAASETADFTSGESSGN